MPTTDKREVKVVKKLFGLATEFEAKGNKLNSVSLPIFLSKEGLTAAQIVKLGLVLNAKKVGETVAYASGTDYATGGRSIINEPYSELVDLPTGAKVMTANATAGLVEQAVQSFIRSTGGLAGMQNERPIILHNYMDGVMNVNGKLLGKIAFENIDRNVRMQYGN